MSSNEDGSPPADSYFIGQFDDVVRANRMTTRVNGRDVLVLHHQGELHAMDAHCYHAGGLLQHGDIEEVAGRLCIVCPWHKKKICLSDGEVLYETDDPSANPTEPRWRSEALKQRVHRVTIVGGGVYVTLNAKPEHFDSDYYQTNTEQEQEVT